MSIRALRERTSASLIWLVSLVIPLLTIAVIALLYMRSRPILAKHPLSQLLRGTDWAPTAGHFGFKPFIAGTVWVTVLAMVIATPICLLTAIYLSEYAHPRARAILRPLLDVLAGIPSVVYGLFGMLVIVPLVADHLAPWAAAHLSFIPFLATPGFSTGYTILAGGLVLGLMVIPFIVAVADEVLHGVPRAMREASLSLGATRWETVKHVLVRASLPGLVAAVVLGFSRAFGETMAVLMVVGNVWQMPHSIFDPAYPLPALIANNYGEMMSIPLYDAALLLAALILLVIVLAFNLMAQLILVVARKEGGLMTRRSVEEVIFKALMYLSTFVVVGALLLLLAIITVKGARGLNLDMLTKIPTPESNLGEPGGGVLNAIVGSLLLALGATAVATLLALPVVLFLQNDYAGRTWLAGVVRTALDLLWGIPSIVYGAFGFTVLLYLGMRASLLGGIIALTLVEFPIMARAMDEVLRLIPSELKEASYAIGATRWETMRVVVVRQALPGLVTAILLAFGRGIGDAASVLFTAGYTDNLPQSLFDPVASLPLAVFSQQQSPFPEVQAKAHVSALILLIIVLFVSIIARLCGARLSRFAVR